MHISEKSYLEETFFLLNDVIKVGVLTHSDFFKHLNRSKFKKIVEKAFDFAEKELKPFCRIGDLEGTRLDQGITKTPLEFGKIWEKIIDQNWLKAGLSLASGGQGFPEVITSVITEIFLMANPSFALYYLSTVESARLIDLHGSQRIREMFGNKLINGQCTGTCSFSPNSGLIATHQKDHFSITGNSSGIIGGTNDLTDNVLQILPARIKTGAKYSNGLFIIPTVLEVKGKLIPNHVTSIKKYRNIGIKGVSINDFEYGLDGVCKGYLLMTLDHQDDLCPSQSLEFLTKISLLGTAKLANIFSLAYFKTSTTQTNHFPREAEKASSTSFDIAIKSFYSGLRGALLSASFSNDCSRHGGKAQKEIFFELFRIYTLVLKVYTIKKSIELYQNGLGLIGISGYASEHPFEQNFRDLLAGCFLGGENAKLVQGLVNVLRDENGQSIGSLVDEYQHIDPHEAKSDPMRLAIGTWHDFLGGLIVLHDDCINDKDGKSWQLFGEQLLLFLGDLIVCYHLILQGLEAEKKMEALGANFFNLDSDVGKDPEIKKWYEKVLLAFHFSKNELTSQESQIRIIQEKVHVTVGL